METFETLGLMAEKVGVAEGAGVTEDGGTEVDADEAVECVLVTTKVEALVDGLAVVVTLLRVSTLTGLVVADDGADWVVAIAVVVVVPVVPSVVDLSGVLGLLVVSLPTVDEEAADVEGVVVEGVGCGRVDGLVMDDDTLEGNLSAATVVEVEGRVDPLAPIAVAVGGRTFGGVDGTAVEPDAVSALTAIGTLPVAAIVAAGEGAGGGFIIFVVLIAAAVVVGVGVGIREGPEGPRGLTGGLDPGLTPNKEEDDDCGRDEVVVVEGEVDIDEDDDDAEVDKDEGAVGLV